MMETTTKRLFFGFETEAPWPSALPHGRLLDPSHRHITLAFLGQTDFTQLSQQLSFFPSPPFLIGPVGKFTECLFLPLHHANVAAWKASWLHSDIQIREYQKRLITWLAAGKFLHPDSREWLPHATLCRRPFNEKEWIRTFYPLPFITTRIHLYESLGSLQYTSIWNYPLTTAFGEIEHTADLAFHIRGETLEHLYLHAFTALAFKFPPLLPFYAEPEEVKDVDDLVISLNDIVARADQAEGCPFKAISFHGEIENKNPFLEWEMIIDV